MADCHHYIINHETLLNKERFLLMYPKFLLPVRVIT